MKRLSSLVITVALAFTVIPGAMTHAAPRTGGAQGTEKQVSHDSLGQHDVTALSHWPARAPMNDMTCPGIRVCLADGDVGVPAKLPSRPPKNPPAGLLAYTDDGGTSWTVRTYPRASFGRIACANPTQCFVLAGYRNGGTATGVLMVTQDGGKTWQQDHCLPGRIRRRSTVPGLPRASSGTSLRSCHGAARTHPGSESAC